MDFEKYTNSKFYAIFDFLYKLIIINILWFFTSFVGLIVLAFMPATIAGYIMMNSVIKQKDFPLFKTFFKIFTKEYFRSQKLFLVFLVIGLVLYTDITFFYHNITLGTFNLIGWWVSVLFTIIYILTLINSFLVYFHFPHLTTFKMVRLSFLFSLAYPFQSLFIVLVGLGLIALLFFFPQLIPLIPFLSIVLIAYVSLKVLAPKHKAVLRDKLPLSVENYL